MVTKTNEFKVRDSKIKLSVYHVVNENGLYRVENRGNLMYKFAITVGEGGNNIRFVPLKDEMLPLANVSVFYLITEIKAGESKRQNLHNNAELLVILRTIIGLPIKYLSLMESLFLSTKDDDLITSFNRAYGEKQFQLLKEGLALYIQNNQENLKLNILAEKVKYPVTYGSCNSKYSVFSLLQDLAKDHAEVSIEGFVRVTDSKVKLPDNVKFDNCPWKTVISVMGNKQRANLSLSYRTFVDVDVPDNNLGISKEAGKGLTCIRTINVVSDGVLNINKLKVRLSDPSLKKKLHSMKVLVGDTVDLTKLPIIEKTKIGKLYANQLAMAKVSEYVSKIAVQYYETIEDMNKGEKKIDPQIQFLESLGIYGKKFYPSNAVSVDAELPKKFSTALITYINNVPSDTAKIQEAIVSYIKTGEVGNFLSKNKSAQLKWILDKVNEQGKDLEFWSKKLRACSDSLKYLTLRMIISKTVNFKKDHHSPYIEDIECKVPILGDSSYMATVKWKLREVNIQ